MSGAERPMVGLRVMIAEDQYTIAAELRRLLEVLGVDVLGPYPSVVQAMQATSEIFDAALLDVNLNGVAVFPVADELASLGVPFAFVTAYNADILPARYQAVPRVEKPVDPSALMNLLDMLTGRRMVRMA